MELVRKVGSGFGNALILALVAFIFSVRKTMEETDIISFKEIGQKN